MCHQVKGVRTGKSRGVAHLRHYTKGVYTTHISATNMNEEEHFDEEKAPLNQQQTEAIELRYSGKTLKQISELIDVPYELVRKWFAPGMDNLYPAYCEYADARNEQAKQIADRKLKALISKAVDAIGELVQMADKDSTRLAAAEGVLERTFGKVTQNINLIGTEQLKENVDLLKGLAGIKPNADDTAGPGAS